MQKDEYEVQVAEDGRLLLFLHVHAICSRYHFNKKILRKIMGVEYRESSACVVT
jgi:hypothetical protein